MKKSAYHPVAHDLANRRIQYPMVASPKLDGHKYIIQFGEVWTKGLKDPPNENFKKHFAELIEYSRAHQYIFEGEVHRDGFTLGQIGGNLQSKNAPLTGFIFHIFENATYSESNGSIRTRFIDRANRLTPLLVNNPIINVRGVPQILVKDWKSAYHLCIDWFQYYEGIILRDPNEIFQQIKRSWKNGKRTQSRTYKFRKDNYARTRI